MEDIKGIKRTRLVCGASRRNGEWVVNTVQNQVVNTGHVVNHVVNSERSESTLRGVRGAPGAHSRRVTTDRPPITRRRRAPRTEQTTPRPGPLLCSTAEHTSGPQNVFAAEERPELRRSPAGNGVACSGEYANAGSNGRFGLDCSKPARCPSRKFIAAISAKLLSENHAVAYLHRFLVD